MFEENKETIRTIPDDKFENIEGYILKYNLLEIM